MVCSEDGETVTEPVSGQRGASKGSWVVVDPGDRPSFRGEESFDFVPLPVSEMENLSFSQGSAYYCELGEPNGEHYEVLRRLAESKNTILVSKGTFRRGPYRKVWTLQVFDGNLVLRELAFPEEIRKAPEYRNKPKVSKALMDAAKAYVSTATVDADAFDFRNEGTEAFRQWLTDTGTEVIVESHTELPAAPGTKPEDLAAALRKATK